MSLLSPKATCRQMLLIAPNPDSDFKEGASNYAL
jgi:hypothetical protein